MKRHYFFGFKIRRARQWLTLVWIELRDLTWVNRARVLAEMIRVLSTGTRASPSAWRKRYRTCRRCDLLDPTLRRCRPYSGSPLGCGCWTPLVCLYEEHCWGHWNLPKEDVGW